MKSPAISQVSLEKQKDSQAHRVLSVYIISRLCTTQLPRAASRDEQQLRQRLKAAAFPYHMNDEGQAMRSHSSQKKEVQPQQTHFVYIVQCRDGTLYTGYTQDVTQRIAAHNAGTGAKYTRGRGPVVLLASWSAESKQEALRAEYAIKQLSRGQKWHLIGGSVPLPQGILATRCK